MAFLLSNIAAKAAEERKKKEAQPKDGGFFLANAASEAAAKRPTREPEPAPTQAGGYTSTAAQLGRQIGRDAASSASRQAQMYIPKNILNPAIENNYLTGTDVPIESERGKALAQIQDNAKYAQAIVSDFENGTNAARYRDNLTPEQQEQLKSEYRAAREFLAGAGDMSSELLRYNSDEEYQANLDAIEKAMRDQQRRENLDPTEAAWQLDQLKRQYEETKRIFASTNPDDLIVDTSEKLGRRDEILDNLAAQIAQLEADLTAKQNETRYAQLMRLPDFEQSSQYIPHERVSGTALTDPSGEGLYKQAALQYEAVNGNKTAINQYNRATNNSGNWDGLAYMTDDERRIYNYFYNRDMQSEDSLARDDPETHGESGAYINEIMPTLNARMRAEREEEIRKYAEEHPFAASAASVFMSPLKAASFASQLGEYAATGEIDPNASGSAYAYLNSATRAEVSHMIERKWGKPGSFAYQTGMSMADNLWQMVLTGGSAGEGAMLAIMGTGAAADSVLTAKSRGLSDGQAIALGITSGAIEAITERIGLDALYDGIKGGRPALTAILRSTLAEGSEEVLGTFLDDIADMIITGTDSERMRRIEELKAQGMSDSEAAGQAFVELLKEAGVAGLGGALSGLLMSGGAQALMASYNSIAQSAQNARDARESQQLAEELLSYMYENNPDLMTGSEYAAMPSEAPSAVEGTSIPTQETVDTTETENAAQPVLVPQTQTETAATQAEPVVTPEQRAALERDAMAAMQRAVSNSFGKAGAEAAMSAYDPQSAVNTMDYLREFTSIYNAARNGTALPDHTNVLTKAQQEAAYTSGIADRAEALQTAAEKSTIEVTPAKRVQFEALQAADVQSDDFEAITAPEQIMTFAEAVQAAQGQKGQADFDLEDAQAALDKGEITVYSAGPITTGSFVTPSRIVAQSMTNGRISSTTVPLDSVAWTDYAGGQYVGTEDIYNGGEGNGILPDRSERNDGSRAGEQAEGVVGSAGQARSGNESGQKTGARSEAEGADSLTVAEEKVTSADLGIKDGRADDEVRVVTGGTSEDYKRTKALAEKLGYKVTLVKGSMHVEGVERPVRGVIQGKNVWIQMDDPDFTGYQILQHEHAHELIDSGEIDENAVRDRIAELYGGREAIDTVARLYAELHSLSTAEEAWTEIVCDSYADMNAFAKDTGSFAAYYQQMLQDVRSNLDAKVNTERGPPRANKNTAQEGGATHYSIDPRFEREIDAWDGKDREITFHVGTTSEVLNSVGIKPGVIQWQSRELLHTIDKHNEITLNIVKQVPEILEHPVVIMKSQLVDDRITLFGEVNDAEGNPVLAVLEINPKDKDGAVLDLNLVKNAYAKDKELQQFLRTSGYLYLDAQNNRADTWLEGIGLKLPSASSLHGSIGKVTYSGNNVNIQSVPFGEIFGTDDVPIESRVSGDALENARDLITDIKQGRKGKVDRNGHITLYHRTSAANAAKILETGIMNAKEDGLFFSTKENGYNDGYGDTVVKFHIPAEMVELDDDFGDELHFRLPLENGARSKDMSQYLFEVQPEAQHHSSMLDPEALEEQNEQLRKDLQAASAALAKAQSKAAYWEGQTKPSAAPSPDATDINRFAKYLVSTNATNLKAKDIAPALTEMAEYIMRGGNAQDELTFTGVKERAVDIAHNILQNYSELQDSTALSDYKEIRKHIRDWGTIRVPGNDLPPDFKDWKAAHRWLRVAVSTGTDIDMVYKDLSTSWPWIFPPDANYGSDQLYAIAEGVRAAEPAYWNPNDEMMAEATEYLANQIIDGLVNGYVDELGETVEMPIRQAHTYADRMQKKLADQKYDAAQKLEEQKAIMQAAVRQARERSDQRLANLKAHYAEVQQNARQRKMESNMRTRLLKIARRLSNKKLPTVNRALLNEYIGQLDLVAKNMTGKTREHLQALKDLYDEAVKENPDFKDDEFKAKIERLEKVRIADMTIEEVQDLTDVLLGLEHAFNTAKKELDSADRRDVYQKGMQIVADIEGGHQGNGRFEELKDKFVSNTLSPLRLIRMFTGYVDSDPLYATAKRLNDGQHTADSYVMQSSKKFNQWTENKEFMKRLTGKDASTITIRGVGDKGQPVEVEITPDMRLSLYLHSKNKQNMKHISSVSGGLTVPDMKLYKQGKISQAYAHSVNVRLTENDVNAICANMTAQDRALADAIYKYFNETSREALTDVYERLKGYPMRVVENYFPIKSNSAYTKGADDNLVFDGTLEGAGWLKERVSGASNPIMLEDATSVLLRAIQSHGRFIGLSIPISDFNKLFQMSGGLYTEDGEQYGKVDVKKTLGETWGPRAEEHIKKMLGDLQSTYSESNSWDDAFSKLRSLYAKATLELNLSVAMKQAGSYPTAAAVLGWKPLARALADFGKVDLDYIASMTPLQWLRSQGYSTPELGDLKKQGRQLPKALNWIQGMDLLTTRKLWKACEYYMEYNHADMKKGSAEYRATISELYNRVIEETQPNYTVMQRPELLRSDKGTWKGLMMFRTQLFQNFNIAADAYGNLMAKKRQYMANPNEETQARYADAKKNAGRAASALIVQAVVIAAVQLGWNALRGKLKRYKDEDKDKITAGSFLKRFGTDFAGNIFSMIPLGGEVFSLVSTAWTGDKWYGFESVDATMLTDILNAFGTAVTQIGKSLEAAQSGQTAAIHKQVLAWESIAESGAKIFGVPASNVMNLIKAVYGNITKTACGKYYGEYLSMLATTPIEGNKGQYYDLLYKAQQENPEAFWEIYNSLIEIDAMASDKKSTAENIDAALKQRAKKAG